MSATAARLCVRSSFRAARRGFSSSSAAAAEGAGGQYVEVNGVRLWVVERGVQNAHSVPIVCLPGALGTAETDFEKQLCERDGLAATHRVVSFDPRGYGRSRGPYTCATSGGARSTPTREFLPGFYRQDAEDVAAVMAALQIPRYFVLGWSDGAIASVMLAAMRPHNVAALAMFGGNAYFTDADIAGFEATRDVAASWSDRMRTSLEAVYGDDLQPMWSAACDAWAHIVEHDGGEVCRAEAAQIACPTLVLHGAKDPMVPEEHARFFEETIPATLYTFPGGKHNIHQRFAAEFNEVVRRHFDGIDR